jgi:pyruvate/2-oxoglutarate dehydrogenase complex dihydrolipoamide acyltransferase (E2) component
MVRKEFKLPDIGEGIAEGEIVSWKVKAGQAVKEEDDFVEVMTDKATVTITVPFTGVIAELRYKEGDVVPVGAVIAVIDAGAAGGTAAAPAPAPAAATPAAPAAPPRDPGCRPGARSAPPAAPRRPHRCRAPRQPCRDARAFVQSARARCSPRPRRDAARASSASTSRRSRHRSAGRVTNDDLAAPARSRSDGRPAAIARTAPVCIPSASRGRDRRSGSVPRSAAARSPRR